MRWIEVQTNEITHDSEGKEWKTPLGSRTIQVGDDEFDKVSQKIADIIGAIGADII